MAEKKENWTKKLSPGSFLRARQYARQHEEFMNEVLIMFKKTDEKLWLEMKELERKSLTLLQLQSIIPEQTYKTYLPQLTQLDYLSLDILHRFLLEGRPLEQTIDAYLSGRSLPSKPAKYKQPLLEETSVNGNYHPLIYAPPSSGAFLLPFQHPLVRER